MAESSPASLPSSGILRHFYRRLGKWQFRGVMASIVSAISGFAGQVHARFIADPVLDSSIKWNDSISWHALVAGLAFLVAFILFFWVRSFLKWGLGIILLLVTGAAVVSYLTGLNLDMTRVQEGYSGASNWIWQQSKTILGLLTGHFPGAAAAGLGAWMGFGRGK